MQQKLNLPLLISLIIPLFFNGCKSDDPEKIWDRDRGELLKYISENDLEAIEHSSGIFYVVDDEGTGQRPTLNSRVNIRYTGTFLDGKIFDASNGATFTLRNTIQGWQIGIPLFRVGGKGKLLIPSALAYGQYPPWGSGIPRNACLVFEIEIIDLM
jgi:FKBP-type peptidyl-prolyl cis-trans isomerase FkpA